MAAPVNYPNKVSARMVGTTRSAAALSFPAAMALVCLLVAPLLVAAEAARFEDAGVAFPLSDITRSLMTVTETTSDAICVAEATACSNDQECDTCLAAFVSGDDNCLTGDTDDQACSDVNGYYCCVLENEDKDCLDSAKFDAYVGACTCFWFWFRMPK